MAPRRLCAEAAEAAEAAPSWHQLLLHARLAAVPMVGFGFMDNIIMIQAGDFIDYHLGTTLAISTLTAAALGNVCSDSSGVLFGGVVETASAKLNLTQPKLTPAQLKMPVTRRVAVLGQLLGVICGCCLGMTNLLFMDLEATERMKMAAKLDTVFAPVVRNCQTLVKAERFTLFLYDDDKRELWTRVKVSGDHGAVKHTADERVTQSTHSIIKVSLDAPSLAADAARTRTLLNIKDVHSDPRFDASWDKRTGFVTQSMLCMPILDADGKLYGCLQAINKLESKAGFSQEDEKLLKMVSSHITIFVDAVMNGDAR